MATGAIHPNTGSGVLVTIDGTALGEVADMPQVSDAQADEIEATHFQSTAKEYLAGLIDFGEAQLKVNLNPANEGQRKAFAAVESGVAQSITVLFPFATPVTLSFQATVRQFKIGAATGSVVSADITLRVTGSITGFPAPGS